MEDQAVKAIPLFGALIFQCFLTLAWSIVSFCLYKRRVRTCPTWVESTSERHPNYLLIQSLYLWGMATIIIWFSVGITTFIAFVKGDL